MYVSCNQPLQPITPVPGIESVRPMTTHHLNPLEQHEIQQIGQRIPQSLPKTCQWMHVDGRQTPGNLSKGSTASLTATWFSLGSSVNSSSASVLPLISRLAYLAMGCPMALATKGTVLDALGFASMMYTCTIQASCSDDQWLK